MSASLLSPVDDGNIRQRIAHLIGIVCVFQEDLNREDLNREVEVLLSIGKGIIGLLHFFPTWAWGEIKMEKVREHPTSLKVYFEYISQMSGCINDMVLRHFDIPTMGYTPKIIKATLQAFVTVLEQIAPMLDNVSQLVGIANDESMVALLKKTINDAKSQPQEKEPQEEQKEEVDDGAPIQRIPALPLPYYTDFGLKTLGKMGISRYDHHNRHTIGAMPSQLKTSRELQQIVATITDTAFTGNVSCDDLEQLLTLLNEMIHLHQVPFVSGTISRYPPPFLNVLKEMHECSDESRLQQLLLCLQCHMERGMSKIEELLHREPLKAFYIPDVNPEDDADVLAPRAPMHQSLREYAKALLTMVNKIMTPSA
jgi:hypothetical protein